jgi:hypothetical protein
MADRDTKLLLARALRDVAPQIAAEPRPQPALRVGGIGRRKIAPDRLPAIDATLRKIFAILRESAEVALQKKETSQWFSGALDCAVITPLAEGADRLIACAGMAEKWKLGAVLPFPQAGYEQTFDLQPDKTAAIADFRALLPEAVLPKGHGVFVLDGKSSSEEERLVSYRNGATAIIHRSDFIIAIVEHTESLSETGSSVREAVALRVPLILVHPETPDRFRLVLNGKEIPESENQTDTLTKAVQGLFPGATPKAKDKEKQLSILDFADEKLRCAPLPAGEDKEAQEHLLAISDFEFSGPCTCSTRAPFWLKPFSGLNAGGRKILRRWLKHGKNVETAGQLAQGASTLSFDPETAENFARLFMHYHRADQAANAYAELQRSAYIFQALLAILVGVLTAYDAVSDPSWVVSAAILVLLVVIYAVVIVSENDDWQGRWLDYRLLAETLRAGKALLVAGKGSPLASTRESVIKLDPGHWVGSHTTNIFRSLKIAVPGRTQNPDAEALGKAHQYINSSYIGGQARYHAVTADYEKKLGKALQKTSWWIAVVVIFVAGVNAGVKYLFPHTQLPAGLCLDDWAIRFLAMFAIILPAAAAALVTLRGYNQYELVSRRSAAMAAALAERLELERPFESYRALGDHALIAAHMILRDIEGWMDIFITKRME